MLAGRGATEAARQLCSAQPLEEFTAEPGPEKIASGHYNAACCFALAGDPDAAFGHLDQAVGLGWRDLELLEQDQDLASLHADPRWRPLLDRLRAGSIDTTEGGRDSAPNQGGL